MANYTVQISDDGTAVTIRSTDGTPLTSKTITVAATEITRRLRDAEQQQWEAVEPQLQRELKAAEDDHKITSRYLATLAKAYEAVPSYLRPVQTLATMLNRSPDTVKMHLVRARDRGLLSPGEPGKGQGTLTQKGETALRG